MSIDIAQAGAGTELTEARELLAEYMEWTKTVEGDAHDAPTFQGHREELANLPGPYTAPAGRLLLARVDGRLAGCVALKPHSAQVCELKRFYVRPEFRGRGVGEQLARHALSEARAVGYERIVLDSHISMKSAHAIYRALGFRLVDAPKDFPERFRPVVVFMEMDLI
jgi:carbonic anhydrase